jgi:hypothetical protein
MPKRVTSLVIAVSAAFPIVLIALSIICPALAGTECIEQPTPKPAAGSHWYYTSDSVKNRKCWFLTVAGAKERQAVVPQGQSNVAPTQTISSSSAFGGSRETKGPAASQSSQLREPRAIQASPDKMPKVAGIAPREKGDVAEIRADQNNRPPLNKAKREALFEEFLRWYDDPRNTRGEMLHGSLAE